MNKLKVALIGAGQIARSSHLPNYLKMQQVSVLGICDANLETAKRTAQQFGIERVYNDYHIMLQELKPDLVSICVPNRFHCEITIDALNAGCHVLCEKPPAMSVEEAERMEKTAKENKKILTYGFHLRYGLQTEIVKKKIEAGEFGKVYRVDACWLRRRGIPGWGSFTDRSMQGGGALIDIGAHMLDLAFYLLGYPAVDYVCAVSHDLIGKRGGEGFFGSWDGKRFTVEDELSGFIRFKNDISLSLSVSFALNMKEKDFRSLRLYGEKLGAEIFPLELYGEDQGQQYIQNFPFMEDMDLHARELLEVTEAAENNRYPLVKAEEGTYLQKILEAFYKSAESGKPVYADENEKPV